MGVLFRAMGMAKSIYSEEHKYLVGRLRQAREKANLTQKQVAKLLGVTQSFISKVESGQYRIDVIQLSRFAKLYRKGLSFLTKEMVR